jgi:alkylhydroperoxidase family enzyme
MTTTARIPLVHTGPFVSAMSWYSRRAYGDVLEPGLAMAHNRKVLLTSLRRERSVEHWDALDVTLKRLAEMAAAATVGCSWCMDFGYWVSHSEDVDPKKLEAVTSWRTSDVYTDLERRVIEYAEAMSTTPLTVTDDMVTGLREHIRDAALVELTAIVALENERSRFNAALGFPSQGFRAQCELRPVQT